MTAFRRVLHGITRTFRREPWWAEFWSATTAVSWAMLSSIANVALYEWPSMQVLLELGSDRFWHAAGFGLGALQLVFLLADHRWLRWGAAVALSLFWGVLTVGVWAATPWAPAAAVYAGWCGINLFSITRLLRHYA